MPVWSMVDINTPFPLKCEQAILSIMHALTEWAIIGCHEEHQLGVVHNRPQNRILPVQHWFSGKCVFIRKQYYTWDRSSKIPVSNLPESYLILVT